MAYLPASRALSGASHPKPRRRSLWDYLNLARQRRDLSRLDRHLLKDIGLSEDDARLEAERPIWDAPDYWR